MSGFFDTTGVTSEERLEYETAAALQDRLVLSFFAGCRKAAGPSEVYERLKSSGDIDESTPLTSIRRSITNLTKRGLLEKTEARQVGAFGRPECLWQFAEMTGVVIYEADVVAGEQLQIFQEGR